MGLILNSGMTLGPGFTADAGYTPLPGIVQSGILLNFDAANYSGTGNWIDAANGINATPQDSPVWSSDDGGTFVLSGTSHFTVPWPTLVPAYTIDIWFNLNGAQPGAACLISDQFSGPFQFCIQASGNRIKTGWYPNNWEGQFADNNVGAQVTSDGSTWYNIVMAVGATEYKDYINGAVSYTLGLNAPGPYNPPQAPTASSPSQMFYIGHRWDNPETIQGKIAVVNIYNRALTDAEVIQNFNYYRARYGL